MVKRRGYKAVYIKDDHPYFCMAVSTTKHGGVVPEHRFAMATLLGRPLTKEEIVHHIDGNRLNNSTSNLLLADSKEHFRIHLLNDCKRRITKLEGELTALRNIVSRLEKYNKEIH